MDDVLTLEQIKEIFDELGLEIQDDAEAIKRRRLERSADWKRQALSPNRKTQEKARRREQLCRRLEEHLDEQMEVVRREVASHLSSAGTETRALSADQRHELSEELREHFGLSSEFARRILSPPSSSLITRLAKLGRRLLDAIGVSGRSAAGSKS